MTDDPYVRNRLEMVNRQLIPNGITDERTLNSMKLTPRHLFVPPSLSWKAYEDCALPIGHNQTISQPLMVALMTQALQLDGGERVLEIGCGSGYQAAVLAPMVEKVVTIERIPELAHQAEQIFRMLNLTNIELVIGDGTLGYLQLAPYDAIIVTAGAPQVPKPLLDQLALGGRLVIPVGKRDVQCLEIHTKATNGTVSAKKSDACVFVPLIGRHGWDN